MSSGINEGHVLLLVQPRTEYASRIYLDFDILDECLAYLKLETMKMEQESIDVQPNNLNGEVKPELVEEVDERTRFSEMVEAIDDLYDLGIFVYSKSTNSYTAHNKDWVKMKLQHMYVKTNCHLK